MWRNIDSCFGFYEVSDSGKIRNKRTGYILKPCMYRGAACVKISKPPFMVAKRLYVKNEVARKFVDNPHEYRFVNVLDQNPFNCSARNLEWVAVPDSRAPRQVYDLETGLLYSSVRVAAEELGLPQAGIYRSIESARPYKGHWFSFTGDRKSTR